MKTNDKLKKTYKLIAFLFLALLFFINENNILAQDTTGIPFVNRKTNKEIQDIAKLIFDRGWIEFKKEKQINPNTIFRNYHSAFGLSNNDVMQFVSVKNDDVGYSHYRYQQYYKGIKVEGGEYIVHASGNIVIKANGKIVDNLSINTQPSVSEELAINIAKNEINANKYMWETENKYNPNGQLVILCKYPKFSYKPENYCLAYKIDIYSKEPFGRYWVYVDAHNGTVVKNESSIYFCSTGSCVTSFYGTRNFTTKYRGWPNNDYILKDECRGDGIHTKMGGSNVDDGDNQWSLPSERPATTTHWAMQMTFDFFLNTYNRSSFDGASEEIRCFSKNNANGSFNAFYDSNNTSTSNDDSFNFGEANGNDGYNTLDVVGHEFMHGVIQFQSNLNNSGESGSLGESFGDIFGEMVELYTLGTNDFIHRQEIGGGNRSLINPKSFNHPNTYQGQNWAVSDMHERGSVQDYWFYLLSVGGSGFVDDDMINEPYTVSGIGSASAARIAYHNVCNFLSSYSDYADSKNGSIWAAMDLYGECSNEVIQTIAAWNAVGVSSTLGAGYDITISCPIENWVHYALHDIIVYGYGAPYNCTISSGNYSILAAGNSIRVTSQNLVPGVKIMAQQGSYYHAYINPCLSNNTKMTDNNYDNSNNISESEALKPIINKDIGFIIFPNPSTGIFTISMSCNADNLNSIKIYNTLGNKIYQSDFETYTKSINISSYPKGIYIVKVYSGNNVFIEKVVYQ